MAPRKKYKALYEEELAQNCDLHNEIVDLKDDLEDYKSFTYKIAQFFGPPICNQLDQMTEGDNEFDKVLVVHPIVKILYTAYIGKSLTTHNWSFITHNFIPMVTSRKSHISLRSAVELKPITELEMDEDKRDKLNFILKELGLGEDNDT